MTWISIDEKGLPDPEIEGDEFLVCDIDPLTGYFLACCFLDDNDEWNCTDSWEKLCWAPSYYMSVDAAMKLLGEPPK